MRGHHACSRACSSRGHECGDVTSEGDEVKSICRQASHTVRSPQLIVAR